MKTIRLFFAGEYRSSDVRRARVIGPGGEVWEGAAASWQHERPLPPKFRLRTEVEFVRSDQSAEVRGGGDWWLEIETKGDMAPALWCRMPDSKVGSGGEGLVFPLAMAQGGEAKSRLNWGAWRGGHPTTDVPVVDLGTPDLQKASGVEDTGECWVWGVATVGRRGESWSRLRLLAHAWGLGESMWIPAGIMALGSLMFAVGTGLLAAQMRSPDGEPRPWIWGVIFWSKLSVLAVFIAWIAPPFQAPDEPTHYVSCSQVWGDADGAEAMRRFAAVSHFSKFPWRRHARLVPEDFSMPSEHGWSPYVNADPIPARERSAMAVRYWQCLRPMIQPLSGGWEALALRMANACLVGLGAGLCGALMAGSGVGKRELLGSLVGLGLLPVLPFFGMHISNYSVWIACLVSIVPMVLGTGGNVRSGPLQGLFLGVVIGIAAFSSRGVIPLIPFLMVGLVLQAFFRGPSPRARWIFWICVWGGLQAGSLFATPEYMAAGRRNWADLVGKVIPGLMATPWWLGTAAMVAVLWAVEEAIAVLRRRLPAKVSGLWMRFVSPGFLLMGAAFVIWPFLSWIFPARPLPELELPNSEGVFGYALKALWAVVRSVGFAVPDFAVSESFWEGYGWLDVQVPMIWSAVLTALLMFGSAVGFLELRRSGTASESVGHLLKWAALSGLFLLICAGCHSAGYSVRGRYLIPVYLGVGQMAAVPLVRSWSMRWPQSFERGPMMLAGAILLLHAACLESVLRRYY